MEFCYAGFSTISMVSVIVGAGTLMGQAATPNIRAAIVGGFGLMGGFGIIVAMAGGGLDFGNTGRTAPFTMMAIMNAVLMLVALMVRVRFR